MPAIRFLAIPTETARAYQAGGPDAHGHAPERRVSDGDGTPCRHCLSDVAAGEEYLVLAHRPFSGLQPYAETGPIFLHARACERHPEGGATPGMFLRRSHMLLRGYDAGQRIVYGTGAVVATDGIAGAASALLAQADIAFLHLRSANYNCFQCRIERA